ncbi:MAG: cytochrome oxidase subunit III [Saprospiraceae bacterium]|nr:cytochrome oxidase subunit III [Candidatus Vicinibacter proximus]MBL7824263.1 cytochrome oxidase subunit III [Saprospiraceae bacterium]MCC6843526.1 cytochrome oxidase subunit III [Saprospiraceae bacterium]
MPIIQMIEKELPPNRAQALRFGLWIAMASICMLFGAFTSAYLVRKPVGNWYEFKLPVLFFYSTIAIVFSSIFLEMAYRSYKKNVVTGFQRNLSIGFLLGISFIVLQVLAWKAMVGQGLFIDLNVSVSFLYVISGIHALHVIGGLAAFLISVLIHFTRPFAPDSMKILKLDLLRQYWHFVGILWIYLLVFLILQ